MRVKLDEGAYMPKRAYESDAGMDMYSPVGFEIEPMGSAVVDTGVHIEIPHGYWGKLESKSGLNMKGIVSLGGTIDSGYTGSIRVKLYNFSDEVYRFERGDKVVQIVILPCSYEELVLSDEIDGERGGNGFGSTGKA